VSGRTGVASVLVTLTQFACVGWLLFTGPIWPASPVGILLMAVGVGWVGWALTCNRFGNFNLRPVVRENGQLVTAGPYHFIRHPMYAGTLWVFTGLVLNAPSPVRWVVLGVLAANLVLKIRIEENLLVQRYPEYQDYRKRTRALIPFLW